MTNFETWLRLKTMNERPRPGIASTDSECSIWILSLTKNPKPRKRWKKNTRRQCGEGSLNI